MDELLDVPMAVITPAGRHASAFIGPLTEALGAFVTQFSVLGVDANEFTCKVPFKVSRPAVMMMDGRPIARDGAGESISAMEPPDDVAAFVKLLLDRAATCQRSSPAPSRQLALRASIMTAGAETLNGTLHVNSFASTPSTLN